MNVLKKSDSARGRVWNVKRPPPSPPEISQLERTASIGFPYNGSGVRQGREESFISMIKLFPETTPAAWILPVTSLKNHNIVYM